MSSAHREAASSVIVAAIESIEISSSEAEFFRKFPVAGVTLFRRNIASIFSQISQLNSNLQKLLHKPGIGAGIIAVDQEGGRVSRIGAPFPNLGAVEKILSGETTTEALTHLYNYGFIVGSSLARLGFNVNFAPVCDINLNPDNTAIGDRCFGATAEGTTPRAEAFLQGMQAAGVKGCLKHFPGQGVGSADTHLGTDIISKSLAALEQEELKPFRKMIPQCDMVMISHSIFPHLENIPASLSEKVMRGLLRDTLGYKGLVVSDDMNMKAIAQDDQSWRQAIVTTISHGADVALVCRHVERAEMAIEGLMHEASQSAAFAARLQDAATRVRQYRSKLPPV